MPIILSKDKKGEYYSYGISGKKYHFKTESGKKRAYNKCLRQMRAIKQSENEKGYNIDYVNDNILHID